MNPLPAFRNTRGHLLTCACLCVHAAEPLARPAVGPGDVVVHTRLGGFILGYDIDQNGTEGLLSEALTLDDGRHDIAIETFDQRTGEIIKVVRQQLDSKNGYVTLGIFGDHVGLSEFEHVTKLFVDERRYLLSDPIDADRITGKWTPPFDKATDIISGAAVSQGFDTALFFGFRNRANDFHTYLFTSDVGANTFGPVIAVEGNDIFDWNNSPAVTYDMDGQGVLLADRPADDGGVRRGLQALCAERADGLDL